MSGEERRAISVLVVDDNDDIRETLTELLEEFGYTAVGAANGEAALERLREVRPELILLDLSMPIMNGPQFREAQLADPAIASIPVVVMSAADQAADKASGMRIAGLLSKPAKLQELLDTVSRHCAKPA